MGKKTILAIDDEFSIRYFYKVSLEKDYNVITLKDGQEALDYVKNNCESIDLILLDLMLPGVDGFGLLSKIKTNEMSRRIPVIVVSAKNQAETAKKCRESGAESIIFKPFEPDDLFEKIKSTLKE